MSDQSLGLSRTEVGCRTPVIFLTGFLGSGKTTILNHLLAQGEFAGTGVIVNEFGDTDFNDVAFSRNRADVVAANAGCFCCSSRSALLDSLRELETRAAHDPALRRVIIETSGLAAPAPLLQAMMGDPELVSRYRVAGVITVIDPITGLVSLSESPEAREQAIFADLVLLSKTDVAEPEEVAAVRQRVRSLNPHCDIVETREGVVDAADLLHRLDTAAFDRRSAGTGSSVSESDRAPDQVRAFTIRRNRPASRAGLALWMDLISAYLGAEILRMKGVLDVEGDPTLVESVRHVFHPPVSLGGVRESAVVVIARGLSRDQIERAFEALDFEPLPQPLDPQAFGRFKDIVSRLRSP